MNWSVCITYMDDRRPPRRATRGGVVKIWPRDHQCCSYSVASSSAWVMCEGRRRIWSYGRSLYYTPSNVDGLWTDSISFGWLWPERSYSVASCDLLVRNDIIHLMILTGIGKTFNLDSMHQTLRPPPCRFLSTFGLAFFRLRVDDLYEWIPIIDIIVVINIIIIINKCD